MTVTHDPALARAYATCEAITRAQARNFHYGIRLLPAPRRAALCAVYALARRIDDVGDGDAPGGPGGLDVPGGTGAAGGLDGGPGDKRAALAALRTTLPGADTTRAEVAHDPVLLAVTDAARRFPVPLGAFGELLDGVEADAVMDAEEGVVAPYASFDDLAWYCRCVAGSIGRLCLGVFGTRPGASHAEAAHHADALGIALQQTNILRDIREDLANGRVYLPTGELDAHGVTLRLDAAGRLADPDGALAALIRDAAVRARSWYAEGLRLVPMLDWRSAACTSAMAGIYRRLLEEIAADPTTVYDRRRSLTGWQKASVAAWALTGLGRDPRATAVAR